MCTKSTDSFKKGPLTDAKSISKTTSSKKKIWETEEKNYILEFAIYRVTKNVLIVKVNFSDFQDYTF